MQWVDFLDHDDGDGLRDWMLATQPEVGLRDNWWLGAVLVAVGQIQSELRAGSVPSVSSLSLAVRIIDLATDEGGLNPQDSAIRLANIAGLVAGTDIPYDALPPALRPDIAARRCLDLASEDPLLIARLAGDWKSLPIAQIRRLRQIKTLLTPVLRLDRYVTDPLVAEAAAEWKAVYPRLP